MSTHPYIPLYVDDFEAATAHLSIEEDGVYNRLLRLCWRTPGCSLPDDPAWIARKIRLSMDDFERIARTVLDEFFTLSRGRWIQRRLKREYDDISRKKTARKLAGKKGGDAKALKTKENAAGIATDLPAHTRAFPYPEPDPEIKKENLLTEVKDAPALALTTPPAPAPAPRDRATRLSPDWTPSEIEHAYAAGQGFSVDAVSRMAERFRNYWVSKAGKDATKRDWPATWRNWVLTEAERRPAGRAIAGRQDWI